MCPLQKTKQNKSGTDEHFFPTASHFFFLNQNKQFKKKKKRKKKVLRSPLELH